MMQLANKKFVVTGGGGFVGKAICLKLKTLGAEVVSIARGEYPDLEAAGIRVHRADLGAAPATYAQVFAGAEGVFHVASKVDLWGDFKDFYQTNVVATRNIINVCKENFVRKLVYTSSPSVVADGTNLRNVDETYPIPTKHLAFYPSTKATAEKEVLSANCADLLTIALRPHIIWGPGDKHIIPRIIEKARQGRLFKIGNNDITVDVTYIDDCVNAHILAMGNLGTNSNVAGQAYFISQNEPVKLWDWINEILAQSGLPPINKRLPYPLAMFLGFMCECGSKLGLSKYEPAITRFLVSELSRDHYFNIAKAVRDLGYKPSLTIKEAIKRTFA